LEEEMNQENVLRTALESISAEHKFMLDEGAVTEKPKPTWEEFAAWVGSVVSEALASVGDKTDMEKLREWLESMLEWRLDGKAAQWGFARTIDHIDKEFGAENATE
jgi:hypothetical protein